MVSILVVLDVVLEASLVARFLSIAKVSILVVLDVVLEASSLSSIYSPPLSFNPCCAGCSSGSVKAFPASQAPRGFNPCCAGCSSGSNRVRQLRSCYSGVSILVVLDVVLEDTGIGYVRPFGRVSILVVLDVVLEELMSG